MGLERKPFKSRKKPGLRGGGLSGDSSGLGRNSGTLSQGDPLKRKTSLNNKGKPISRVSKQRKKRDEEYFKVREKKLADNPECEAGFVDECTGLAVDTHHIVARSVAPDRVADIHNLLAVCRICHSAIEDDGSGRARELGLKKFSWED